jgi:beta-N-acetylhexosaminidase
MVGIPGPELDAETRAFLAERAIGGVVLFRRNVRDPETLAALTRDLHAITPDRPMLIAIDQEGGRVTRLGEPFTQFPPAALVGTAGSPHLAYRAGAAVGEELRAVGIDADFAPVLDVHSNPRNPIIGDRAFASHPRLVARMGISFAHGLQRTGTITVGKHFPGHCDTDVDSHLDLPVVRKPLAELERTEIFPFRRAIQEGIDALMTAHVLYPALDPAHPATLSRRILHDLLRERLHFRGVVFSDDLEMNAVSERYGPGEAAVGALEAGCDALLFCEKRDRAEQALDALQHGAERRSFVRARLEEASTRLETLRRDHFRKVRRPLASPAIPPGGFSRNRDLVKWITERAENKTKATA